jgi:hypothetical protein
MSDGSRSPRQARTTSSRAVKVSPSVLHGLESLVRGNEEMLRGMLDGCPPDAPVDAIVSKLREVMGVSGLGVSALLARFFPQDVLETYCREVAACSSSGSATVLADRIEREWSKPGFAAKSSSSAVAASDATADGGEGRKRKAGVDASSDENASKESSASVATSGSDKRLQKLKKQQGKQDAVFLHQRFKVTVDGKTKKGVFTRSWVDADSVSAENRRRTSSPTHFSF